MITIENIHYVEALQKLIQSDDSKILVFAIGTLFAIAIDMVTGWTKSIVTKTPSSDIGTRGLLKHLNLFVLLMVLALFAIFIGTYAIVAWYGLVIYYWLLQFQSVLENLDAMGVDVKGFKTFIQAVHSDGEPKKENDKINK
jgi:toxin secretion/phage lysis holin